MIAKTKQIVKTIILTAIILLSANNTCYAEVDISALEGYLNSVVARQQVNQCKNPKYAYRNDTSEKIDPITGNLILKETDINLPGKDGLDLNIGRNYNSAQDDFEKEVSVTSSSSSYTEAYVGYIVEVLFFNEDSMCQVTTGPYDTIEEAIDMYNYYDNVNESAVPLYISKQPIITYHTTYTITTSSYPDIYSYNKTRYNLGAGWSFSFPSVQIEENNGNQYMYYHDGTGDAYKIIATADTGRSNLEGYQGKDVKFVEDNGSYVNGDNVRSKYKFVNSDLTTAYFASDGRLLGMKDRLNNEIKFRHIDAKIHDKSFPLISQIEDSVGRIITFDYTGNNIELTVTAPNETDQIKILYERKYLTKDYYHHETLIKSYECPILVKVTDPVGRATYYEDYYKYNNGFPIERYTFSDKDLSSSSESHRYLLGAVVCGGTKTRYDYERTIRNLGPEGATDAFRVKARYDQIQRGDASTMTLCDWAGEYNRVDYTYSGDCTGYPDYKSEELMPSTYQFWSESAVSNGLKTKYVFNGIKQQLLQESTAANKEKKVVKNLEFDNTYKYKPTKTEVTEYASDGTLATSLYTGMTYKDWGGLSSSTLPLTLSQYNDPNVKSKYTTVYSYENSAYPYFMTKKQWYQNDTKLLTESNDYDTLGRISKSINAKGEVTSYNYYTDSEDNRIEEITKNLEDGRAAKTKLVYGSETGYAYPKEEIKCYTEYECETETRLSKTYNMLLGLVATETDNEYKTTSYTYDKSGRTTQKKIPDFCNRYGECYSVSEAYVYTDGYNEDYTEENKHIYGTNVDAYICYEDTNNNSKTYYNIVKEFYDAYGNLRNKMSYYNSKWVTDATYTYDNLLRAISYTDAEKNTTTASYNPWGENNETTDAAGNLYVTDYDMKSRKQTSYFVAKDNINSYRASPGSNTFWEDYVEVYLDQFGRAEERRVYENWPALSGELKELYRYDIAGNLVGYTDPKGNLNEDGYTESYQYDELNQAIEVKDAENHTTNVNYTTLGNIESVKLKENKNSTDSITLYTKSYNELGNLLRKADTSGQAAEYSYNSIGLITDSTDRNGGNGYQSYDELNKLTSKSLQSNDGSGSNYYEYYYRNPFGYFNEIQYENWVATAQNIYSFDQKGSILQKNIYTSHIQSNLKMQYDSNGKLASIGVGTLDSNYFYTNNEFTNDRLTKVQTNGSETKSSVVSENATYEYYPDGKLKKLTYPKLNDNTLLTTEYIYNALGRLTAMVNKKDSTVLSKFAYTYDANGNILSINDGKTTKTYVYDKLNRLIEIRPEDGNKTVYSYDLRGNRLMESSNRFDFDLVDTNYTYDVENRLKMVTKGTETTTMEYYADGLRAEKSTASDQTLYVYDLSEHLVAEADSGAITANYVWGPDRVLAKKEAGGGEYYYLYNGHGDVVQMIDKDGKIVNNYKYDEWGNIEESNETINNPFKYAGEVYDDETGLYYLRARYYDPKLGRFINEDSYEGQIKNPMSLNMYIYCTNNPIIYIDPNGHSIKSIFKAIGDGASNLYNSFMRGTAKIRGFDYDKEQQIYTSRRDAKQGYAGYNGIYDFVFDTACNVQLDKVKFEYNNKKWMIEFWMGNYPFMEAKSSVGAEIGIYYESDKFWGKAGDWGHYECAVNNQLNMQYDLYKGNKLLFQRFEERHWWLTGFKPGLYVDSKELRMQGSITFDDPDMYKSFVDALVENKSFTIKLNPDKLRVNFTWDK